MNTKFIKLSALALGIGLFMNGDASADKASCLADCNRQYPQCYKSCTPQSDSNCCELFSICKLACQEEKR